MCIQERGEGHHYLLGSSFGLARVRRISSSKSKREGEPPLWTRERKCGACGQKVERGKRSSNAHSWWGSSLLDFGPLCMWAKPLVTWLGSCPHWLPSCMLPCTHTHCLHLWLVHHAWPCSLLPCSCGLSPCSHIVSFAPWHMALFTWHMPSIFDVTSCIAYMHVMYACTHRLWP